MFTESGVTLSIYIPDKFAVITQIIMACFFVIIMIGFGKNLATQPNYFIISKRFNNSFHIVFSAYGIIIKKSYNFPLCKICHDIARFGWSKILRGGNIE